MIENQFDCGEPCLNYPLKTLKLLLLVADRTHNEYDL